MTTAFLAPVASLALPFGSTLTTSIVALGVIAAAILFGWVCYAIAKSAGYNGWPFFILGFFTAVIGVIITTIVYYIARRKNASLRAAQREAAGPLELGLGHTAEDSPLLTNQLPEQPPQGQPYGRQPAAPPATGSPPAGASEPCPSCGAPVPAGASPCPNCGTTLKWPGSTASSRPPSGEWK